MDWDKLKIFHAVVEAGSFTHAGQALNMSQSAVSRQIGALESSLKVALFHRHARGLILTEQGELLYRAARDVSAKLVMAEAQVAESKDTPKGQLRVTATVALGSLWLAPRIGEFQELYPEVSIDLVLDDRELDLTMREADAAIRMAAPRQPELIQRRLMSVRTHVYGAPSYLAGHGEPREAAELDRHKLIVYGLERRAAGFDAGWLLKLGAKRDRPRRPVLVVNDIHAMMRAAASGLGLAALPDFVTRGTNLVRVMAETEAPAADAYFVYSEELRQSKRIEVFRDFLTRKVAETDF